MLEMSYVHSKYNSIHIGCQIKGICSECRAAWVIEAPLEKVYKPNTRWQINIVDSFWKKMDIIKNWFAVHVCDA